MRAALQRHDPFDELSHVVGLSGDIPDNRDQVLVVLRLEHQLHCLGRRDDDGSLSFEGRRPEELLAGSFDLDDLTAVRQDDSPAAVALRQHDQVAVLEGVAAQGQEAEADGYADEEFCQQRQRRDQEYREQDETDHEIREIAVRPIRTGIGETPQNRETERR